MSILGIIFQQGKASIGGLVIDATLRETHISSSDITENPVEEGAKITDHVQNKPDELIMEGVISDSPLGFPILGNIINIVNTVTTLFGQSSRSQDGYNKLRELKTKRVPFTVITGLKRYENMVIKDLNIDRTATTGKSINFRAVIKEIRIVSSQTGSGLSGNLGGSIAAGAAGSIKDVGQATKDLGNKVTPALPVSNPLSATPASTVSPSKSSAAFKIWKTIF